MDSQPTGVLPDETVAVQHELERPAAEEDGSLEFVCPNCGTGWELTPDEAERDEFTCEDCKTAFRINADSRRNGSRAFQGMLVLVPVTLILIGLGIGIHFIEGFFPSNSYDYYRRGVSRQLDGDLDGAMADFNNAIELSSRSPAAYRARGAAKAAMGDLDGAMADENQAITLDPQNSQAYRYRARIKRAEGDLDGAFADDSEAIVLEPDKPFPYVGRGYDKVATGDFDGAVADYDHAIALDPKYALAYIARGFAKGVKGDFDGAIGDDNTAIALDPKYAFAYNSRGNINAVLRKWTAALADYRQCCDRSPAGQDYPRLYMYLIRARLGDREAAGKELSSYISNRKESASPSGEWVGTIAGYLLGTVKEADFFAAAGSPNARKAQGHTCEAWYYAGMEKLLDGDRKTAAEYLEKCIATNRKDYVEYGLAQSELKALGK